MKLILFFAFFYFVFGEQIQDDNSFMVCVPINSLNVLINGTGSNSQKIRSPVSQVVNKLLSDSADKFKDVLMNSSNFTDESVSSLSPSSYINSEKVSTELDNSFKSSENSFLKDLVSLKKGDEGKSQNEQMSQTEDYLQMQPTTITNQLRDERIDENDSLIKDYITTSKSLLKEEDTTTIINNFYKRLDFTENKDEESVTLVNQLVSESEKQNELSTIDPSLNKGRSILPEEEMNARQNGLISSLLSSINPSNIMNGQNRLPIVNSDSKVTSKNQTENHKNSVEQSDSSLRVSDDSSQSDNYKNSNVSTTTQSTVLTTTNATITNTTLSENQIEQQKIFEEFFGSRQSVNSNLLILLDSIKAKLGIGNTHLRPIEVKKKLEQELQLIKSGINSPTTEVYSATTASYIKPSSNYISSNQNSDSSPKYISYDEAKKQLELMNNYKDSYENDYKSDSYKIGDNKKNLDVPIIVALKPDKKLNKPVADYTENEKNSKNYALPNNYPIGYRAGLPSYDVKPILSRYNKLVSGVSKGYSKFRPPYQNEKKGYILPTVG